MVDERDFNENLPKATPVTTGATTTPIRPGRRRMTDVRRVHTPQELTDGPVGQDNSAWERQKIQNLAAGGLIAGGAAGT